MRYLKTGMVMTLAALALTLRLHGQAPQRESLVWAPVPTTPNGWVAPNKPHTKLRGRDGGAQRAGELARADRA